jgi:hypothetical protein
VLHLLRGAHAMSDLDELQERYRLSLQAFINR